MKLLTKASFDPAESQRERENRQVAYEAACEGMVLLKNKGTLPLQTKTVALYGPGTVRTIKGGTGSGEVNERQAVSVYEGLKNRGFTITTESWLSDYETGYEAALKAYKAEKRKRVNILKVQDIMQMLFDNFFIPSGRPITQADVEASDTDTCIYVLSRQAGEGGDRKLEPGGYYVTDAEEAAIRFCAEHYANFVLLVNCGSSLDLGFADAIPGIGAILYICQPGMEGGNAVADILCGAVTPSGKLTDTWAKQYDDIPFAREYSYLNGNLKDESYKEGIFVGYRYFDSFGLEPAYPFGFGLSYTDFTIRSAGVSAQGREISVTARITNTGAACSGKEVAQLYVSAPTGELTKEYQSLAAFGKTELLAPGQSQELTLRFDLGELASYRERDNSMILEPGDYVLRLGNSSRNTVVIGAVSLPRQVIVSRHEAICPVKEPIQELTAPQREKEQLHPGLPCITLDPEAFVTVVHDYTQPGECPDPRVQAFLDTLSDADMAEIVVGIGMFGGKMRFHLPGAVGKTTSKFWDKGLANVMLCDGPAGLRIQKLSTVNDKGQIKSASLAMSTFDAFPGFVKKMMMGNVEKDTPLYQYATAFPVQNALAQTWNVALLEQVGKAVFREMEEFGCTYWLAPAMNIHRNPLCGRNFEYFSEDPRLTGLLAAAMTRGVQQKEGYYVTIKHFACNNQEDARTSVSSNVSQRALREIYLRGFRIAVQQGGAKSVMTAYNRLNGVYTPNSYDLCTKVLRCEWGFDGVVMTDWFSTNPGQGSNPGCIAAGNDLIMPGGSSFKLAVLSAVKSGKLSRRDLRRCCGNVVKAIFDSAIQKEYLD